MPRKKKIPKIVKTECSECGTRYIFPGYMLEPKNIYDCRKCGIRNEVKFD